MANFWPVPLNPAQENNESRISLPQIRIIHCQPLRFVPSLLSLWTYLRKHSWPTADSQSSRTLLNSSWPQELSCFPAPAQLRMADLSATVTEHAGKFGTQFKMGFPCKQNSENIRSLEAPRISDILTTLRDGKWPTTLDATLFLSEVIADFSAGSFCPPRPIFTLSAEKALWTQGIDIHTTYIHTYIQTYIHNYTLFILEFTE